MAVAKVIPFAAQPMVAIRGPKPAIMGEQIKDNDEIG